MAWSLAAAGFSSPRQPSLNYDMSLFLLCAMPSVYATLTPMAAPHMSAHGYGPNAHNAASHCCYSLAEFEVGRISLRASCMPGRKRQTGSIGTRGINPVGQRSHGLLCPRREALAASFSLQAQLQEYLSHYISLLSTP